MANIIDQIAHLIESLNIEGILKISVFCIIIAILWPIIQSYRYVYEITLINRLNEDCKFATLRTEPGDMHIRGSDDNTIGKMSTQHYTIVPGWKGIYGSNTLHIKVAWNNNDVIIPVYNSGDIQRSRVFFIETTGVREINSAESDAWTWSKDHVFGQQGN